jgi:glycosyltransferase involved in cell wall biosynthesis
LPQFLIKWFVHSKKSRNTIFCANASRLNILNNEDLYGLDMCIELAKLLLSNSFPVSFIFIVSSLENCQNRFNTYKKLIVDFGLQDIFLLINGVFSFVRVIENSDIVLRPTNADGDAVTIREAIFLNKPVLASDVIDRPEGTLLFKNRDINDFYNQTVLLLNNKSFFDNSSSLPIENDSNNYRKYYSNLINNVICS